MIVLLEKAVKERIKLKDRKFKRTEAATMTTIPPEEGREQAHWAARRDDNCRREV